MGQTLNPRKTKSKNSLHKVTFRQREILGDQNIANAMNQHFCTVGEEMNKRIPPTQGHFKDYLVNAVKETFVLTPVIEFDVDKQLRH